VHPYTLYSKSKLCAMQLWSDLVVTVKLEAVASKPLLLPQKFSNSIKFVV